MDGVVDQESRTGGSRRLPAAVSSIIRRPGLWITIAALVAAGVLGLFRARGPLVDVAAVTRADIEQHLVASGRVRVVTRAQLTAQAAGRVTRVAVREGRRVRSGDLLAQIDDAEARAAAAEARAAAARARAQALAKAGAIATTDVEEAQRTLDVARAARNAARAQRQAVAPQGPDAQVAASALRESEARLAAAQVRLAQTRVVASQDGVILERHVDPGDTVRVGDALLELAGDDETELVIEPDERNLAWLRVGQTGTASADAYPDQTFAAEITYIAPAVDRQRGSIEVRLRVPDPPAVLRPDMTVSVDLTVASKQNALTVPSDAIRDAATATPWVLVVEGGVVQRRDVTLGIAGEGQSEIRSGVSEGAIAVLATERALEPGERVRVRQAP